MLKMTFRGMETVEIIDYLKLICSTPHKNNNKYALNIDFLLANIYNVTYRVLLHTTTHFLDKKRTVLFNYV